MTYQYKILFLSTPRKNKTAIDEYKAISQVVKNQSVILQAHVDNIDGKKFHKSIFDAHNALLADEKLIIQYCGDSDIYGFDLPGIEKNEKGLPSLSPEKIKNYLSQFPNIIAFLFTSCDSLKLSEEVNKLTNIDFAVSYCKKLKNKTSIKFSKSFYEKFNETQCFKTAYSYATTQGFLNDAALYNFIPDYKPNPFPYDIKNEKSFLKTNDDKLDSLIELAVQICRINKSYTYDFHLFDLIEKAKNDIQNIDINNKVRFSDFASLKINGKLNIGKEIRIYKLQKRLIFEYVYLVTDTIYNLIGKTKVEYLLEKIKILIKNLNLAITFNINADIEGELYILIDEKINEIHSFLNDTEIKNIDLYIKLHDFISKLTTIDFVTIETSIKNYEFDNPNNIDEISSAIQMIKEKHNEIKNEFKEPLIPIKFTSSWN